MAETDAETDMAEPAVTDGFKHPSVRKLFDYWSARKGARRFPSRRDFDPIDVPDLLQDLLLVEVERTSDSPMRFRFRVAGGRFRDIYGEELTGRWLHELDLGAYRDHWSAQYSKVAETGRPNHGEHKLYWQNREHVPFEWLMLPLGDNGTVTMMLVLVMFGVT